MEGGKSNDSTRVRARISGRVQGVSFRYAAQEEAERLGLSGWVRNLPDGQVEALFQGPGESVQQMLRWCEKGPSPARVTDVETSHEEARDDLTGFKVL